MCRPWAHSGKGLVFIANALVSNNCSLIIKKEDQHVTKH